MRIERGRNRAWGPKFWTLAHGEKHWVSVWGMRRIATTMLGVMLLAGCAGETDPEVWAAYEQQWKQMEEIDRAMACLIFHQDEEKSLEVLGGGNEVVRETAKQFLEEKC